jgi:uncharacterized membrane protein YdjX (TVP38/TMEM64 family)
MSEPLRKKLVSCLPLMLLVALIAVVVALPGLRGLFTRDNLAAFIERTGWYGPVALALVMAISVILSPIPNVPIAAVLGMTYGPLLGTAIAVVGALLGAMAAFLIARHFGSRAIRALTGKTFHFCDGCSERTLSVLVFVARLIPVVSFDIVSYGAGLTQMRFRRFTLWSLLGMIPWTLFYTSVGSAVLDQPVLAAILGGLLAVLVLTLPTLVRRYNLFGLRKIMLEQQTDDEPSV